MERKMRVNQQQSSNGMINRVAQLLQSGIDSKQRNFSDKVSDVEVSGLVDDTVKLSRSKRGIKLPKVKKGSKKKRIWNKLPKKSKEETLQDIIDEAVDYFDDYDEEIIRKKMADQLLIKSVKEANLDIAEECINLGANIDIKDKHGNTPLHIATKRGLSDIAKLLLDKGANIEAKDKHGKTPLHIAAKRGDSDIAKFLLDKGADIRAQEDKLNLYPLHFAVAKGHLDIVKYLVEKGADVDSIQGGYSYSSVLHYAAQKGHFDIVKYLIEKGANPDVTDSDGKTPLQRAQEKGIFDIVEYLKVRTKKNIEAPQITERPQVATELPQITERQLITTEVSQVIGRQQVTTEVPQTTEDYSNITLHFAAEFGNLNAVKYFVERGDDVDAINWYAGTPLILAVSNGHLDVVKYLVEKGANVNLKESTRNAKGWAPLHFAARRGYLDIVKCLIENGADVNANDNYDSTTPLHHAAEQGHLAVAEELIEKNANINAVEKYGYTPLHAAALNGYLDIVKKLIEKGADVNVETNSGSTPLDLARDRGFSQVVEFLSSYQNKSRNRRDVVSSNLWMKKSIIDGVKHILPSSTGSSALLTAREYNSTTVTAIPEINTTVVNNTLLLGILAAGLFNKTQYEHPIHENLLSPRKQSMKLNLIDEDMIIRAIQKGEEKFGDPDTDMDEVKN